MLLLTVTVTLCIMAAMEHDRIHEQMGLTIEELADAADVPVRTVRFYITEGLLPGPGSRGKGATYRQEHLDRLRLIRLLVRQRMPLTEIRQLLARLGDAEMGELLEQEERRVTDLERNAVKSSPQDYIAALLENARAARTEKRSVAAPAFRPGQPAPYRKRGKGDGQGREREEIWYRLTLAPGVELHMTAEARQRYATLIERLREAAEREQ